MPSPQTLVTVKNLLHCQPNKNMRIQLTKIVRSSNISLVTCEKIQYFLNSYQSIKAHMTNL